MTAATPLSARDLNRATLARQGLLEPMSGPPAALVERAGSLQAQHPEWPPVALAARAADRAAADLSGALDRREVVRSSLMRITIHIVTAEDFWPMFEVCRPLRVTQWQLLTKVDPESSDLGSRLLAAHPAAVAALRARPISSLEIDRLLSAEAGLTHEAFTRPAWREPETQVPVRVAWRHFAAFVPLVHVPHEAEGYGRSKYALAEDWLHAPRPEMAIEEARVRLTRRYLAAFGPATLDDLLAYVGRRGPIGAWRDALAALDDELVVLHRDDGATLFDLVDAPRPAADTPAPPRLLARWDSALLSHAPKARQRIIADEDRSAVFSKNADVLPTFLVDGFVAGTWELSRSEGKASLSLRPFASLAAPISDVLAAEADRILSLLEPNAEREIEVRAAGG